MPQICVCCSYGEMYLKWFLPHSGPSFCLADMAKFREVFSKAKHIAIITGAGVSAESGIPTFRGAGGLWRRWKAQVRRRTCPDYETVVASPPHPLSATYFHSFSV